MTRTLGVALQRRPWRPRGLALALGLLLAGCATTPPVGRAEPRAETTACASRLEGCGEPTLFASGARARNEYTLFLNQRSQALPRLPPREQRLEETVIREMTSWMWRQEDALLMRKLPLEVFLDLYAVRQAEQRREEARQAAVEHKLDEYLAWAQTQARHQAREHFRSVGREYLLTESPLREAAQDELVSAVLAWAFRHTEDPDFPRKSPSEVALYLLATRGALATALLRGQAAAPTLDWARFSDKTPEEEADDEARELLLGFVPVVGEMVDFTAFVTGYSITGRRHLEEHERWLCAVGMVVPVLPGRALGEGAEALQRAALLTGRGVDEVYAMTRVVQHLSPQDVRELQRLTRKYVRTGELSGAERDFLQRTALNVAEPLEAMREAFKKGKRVPLLASRTDAAGLRLVPGSPEHMAQAWVDYQFRHPERFPRFRYAPDETWKRMYRTVLENKGAGGAFEQDVLKVRGLEKNTALMMPPPGSKLQGFVPDSVPGNPNPGELVWSKPYCFVEAKARRELALTGNLKAMLDYVDTHGGHVELWVRSAKHPDGMTLFTTPLQNRPDELQLAGKVTVRHLP